MGEIVSVGVLAYALGKLFLTGLGDFWGGRISFLIGLGGATVFTLLFASKLSLPFSPWRGSATPDPVRRLGRLDQSVLEMVRFFILRNDHRHLEHQLSDRRRRGRQWMGMLIAHGFGWRILFYFAAAAAGFFLVVNFFFLRESRLDAGYSEAKPNPLNLYAGSEERPQSVGRLLLPLLRSRAFLLVASCPWAAPQSAKPSMRGLRCT